MTVPASPTPRRDPVVEGSGPAGRQAPGYRLHPALERLSGPSATLQIQARSRQLQAEGRRVFKLGLGQSPFPVPEPVVDALRRHAADKDYLPVRGLPELRDRVAAFHAQSGAEGRCAEDVLIGPGSKELMFLLQLAFDGTTLIPSPAWVSYVPQALLTDRPIHRIETTFVEGWRLTPDRLERACRQVAGPKLLILNYPGNPDGSTYGPDALEALAEVTRRHGVIVLSDEIYGPLQHDGRFVSIARDYPEGTVVSGGLSKWCGAGGWRLGTLCFPRSLAGLADGVAIAASETFTSVSAPVQQAAVTAYTPSDAMQTYVARSRAVVAELAREVTARLRDAGARLVEPRGAFYVFADFTPCAEALGSIDGPELAERLLRQTGVACLPGAAFGRPASELTLRLSLVDFDGGAALEALAAGQSVDRAFLQRCCAPVLQGVDRIAAFVKGRTGERPSVSTRNGS
jgi:aspartate aminotransferase